MALSPKVRWIVAGVFLLAAMGGWWAHRSRSQPWNCTPELTRADFDTSIRLGTQFMLAHQKPEGHFDYEYDWRARTYSPDDNEVRQAGALWGLALLYQDQPSPELAAALERSFSFFAKHAVQGQGDTRCIAYPGSPRGSLGGVALVALAHIEYLRAPGDALSAQRAEELRGHLDGFLRLLVAAMTPEGLFAGKYDLRTCEPSGRPSPYSDGEALLAMVKAAKYLGREDLLPTIRKAADAGYALNVQAALQENPDSDTTKGYYQWSSMAFFELATHTWPETEVYGDAVLELADWMIDVHRTLKRTKNTGYAYEGIIHAYEIARRRGDEVRAGKYACVIDQGLGRLLSWQIGHPRANEHVREATSDDTAAWGGIQNDKRSPGLRIDVTQHQMHAALLARRYVYKE